MKYLCLVYMDEKHPHVVKDSECMAFGSGLRTSGVLLAADARAR